MLAGEPRISHTPSESWILKVGGMGMESKSKLPTGELVERLQQITISMERIRGQLDALLGEIGPTNDEAWTSDTSPPDRLGAIETVVGLITGLLQELPSAVQVEQRIRRKLPRSESPSCELIVECKELFEQLEMLVLD
jgi:hypothetical protein